MSRPLPRWLGGVAALAGLAMMAYGLHRGTGCGLYQGREYLFGVYWNWLKRNCGRAPAMGSRPSGRF